VDCEILVLGLEASRQGTRVPAAGVVAVGEHDDDAGANPIVQNIRGLLHGNGKRCAARRRDGIHLVHDVLPRAGLGRKGEARVVALVVLARADGDEADVAKWRDFGQYFLEGLSHFVDARHERADAEPLVAGHRAGAVEDEHGLLVALAVASCLRRCG
jgi:hypothetical protein